MRLLLVVTACALVLSACGGAAADPAVSADPGAGPAASNSGAAAAPTLSQAPASVPVAPLAADGLPGEPFDPAPLAGAVLVVIGVAAGAELDVRALPGAAQQSIARFGPVATDVVSAGRARRVEETIWYEVQTAAGAGWADASYLAYAGVTADLTVEVVTRLGESPVAASLTDLGQVVTGVFASTQPLSQVVVTVDPTFGNPAEVTYDVVGLGDDSVRGYRVRIQATPTGDQGPFALASVTATTLCLRGVVDQICT